MVRDQAAPMRQVSQRPWKGRVGAAAKVPGLIKTGTQVEEKKIHYEARVLQEDAGAGERGYVRFRGRLLATGAVPPWGGISSCELKIFRRSNPRLTPGAYGGEPGTTSARSHLVTASASNLVRAALTTPIPWVRTLQFDRCSNRSIPTYPLAECH